MSVLDRHHQMSRKGQIGGILWYITYFAALVIILGVMSYLGVNTYTVHTTTGDLSKELIAEYSYHAPFTIDPYTSERTQLRDNIATRLTQLDQADREFAIRIKVGNESYYTDQDKFDILLATSGASSDLKRTRLLHNSQAIDIAVVMEK